MCISTDAFDMGAVQLDSGTLMIVSLLLYSLVLTGELLCAAVLSSLLALITGLHFLSLFRKGTLCTRGSPPSEPEEGEAVEVYEPGDPNFRLASNFSMNKVDTWFTESSEMMYVKGTTYSHHRLA